MSKSIWIAVVICLLGVSVLMFPIVRTSLTGVSQIAPAVSGKFDPSLPQWREWKNRNREDPKWEWKVRIAFYGRVIDQNDQPVPDAKVVVRWANGTASRELFTDSLGCFHLSGVRGKLLLIRSIEKPGYEAAAANRDVFEYAAFFDQNYYVPDAANPVVFRMRRKADAEPLIVVSDKYRIPDSGTLALDLRTGRTGGEDLAIDLLDNSDPTGRRWIARVRAPSGGVQSANVEFPVLAPEKGYVSEVTIDQDTPQPPGFQSGSLYKGARFFVKTGSGYALVEFRMIAGNRSLYFTSRLNPNPDSRDLELDPSKKIDAP